MVIFGLYPAPDTSKNIGWKAWRQVRGASRCVLNPSAVARRDGKCHSPHLRNPLNSSQGAAASQRRQEPAAKAKPKPTSKTNESPSLATRGGHPAEFCNPSMFQRDFAHSCVILNKAGAEQLGALSWAHYCLSHRLTWGSALLRVNLRFFLQVWTDAGAGP